MRKFLNEPIKYPIMTKPPFPSQIIPLVDTIHMLKTTYLPKPMFIAWADHQLWLTKAQICNLYLFHPRHFQGYQLTLKNELDGFPEANSHILPMQKWGRLFHEKCYSAEWVLALGYLISSPYTPEFYRWVQEIVGRNGTSL